MAGSRGPLKLITSGEPDDDELTAQNVVPAGTPIKPEAVKDDEELSALWDAMVPSLTLAAPSDGPVIELMLRHYCLARDAYKEIDGKTTVADHNHGGVKKNPAESVLRAESDMFLRYAQQLGMTPAARARIPMPGGDGAEENPFASGG